MLPQVGDKLTVKCYSFGPGEVHGTIFADRTIKLNLPIWRGQGPIEVCICSCACICTSQALCPLPCLLVYSTGQWQCSVQQFCRNTLGGWPGARVRTNVSLCRLHGHVRLHPNPPIIGRCGSHCCTAGTSVNSAVSYARLLGWRPCTKPRG